VHQLSYNYGFIEILGPYFKTTFDLQNSLGFLEMKKIGEKMLQLNWDGSNLATVVFSV